MEEGVRNHSTPRYSSSVKGRHEKVGKCPIVRCCGDSLRIEVSQSLVLKRLVTKTMFCGKKEIDSKLKSFLVSNATEDEYTMSMKTHNKQNA
mmetsp:Transcript_507/g.1117  ORF Transcript_507/g.1117 Transcript_507/m.1117 type:complete len:92 (+) Transcript_507:266-541(+)